MAIEYQKGSSILHKLDARTKLLMFAGLTVLAIVILDPLIIACLFLILYFLGTQAIDRQMLNQNLRVLVVIFLTFSMFQILFFTPSDAIFLFYLIPGKEWVPVTVQGIVRGVAVFFRFFIVVLSVHLMLYTTPPVDLVLAITRSEKKHSTVRTLSLILILAVFICAIAFLSFSETINRLNLTPVFRWISVFGLAVLAGYFLQLIASQGLPAEMGVALSLGFTTVGILSQQTQKITDAQKARGYDVKPKNIIQRVKVLTALLLPIFLATMERSQDISVAILARGFDYNIRGRTYRRQLSFGRYDYITIAILIALLLVMLTLNRLGFGNPTEQIIISWM